MYCPTSAQVALGSLEDIALQIERVFGRCMYDLGDVSADSGVGRLFVTERPVERDACEDFQRTRLKWSMPSDKREGDFSTYDRAVSGYDFE